MVRTTSNKYVSSVHAKAGGGGADIEIRRTMKASRIQRDVVRMEEGREGGRERERREGGRGGGEEGRKEGWREGGREGVREEGGKEGERMVGGGRNRRGDEVEASLPFRTF